MSAPASDAAAKKPTGGRRRPSDPVSRYAQGVVDGRTVAGRMVRLACQRHFRELAKARSRGFHYYFDAPSAGHILEFFPEYLLLEDGTPFRLTPWAQFALGSFFGWRRVSDNGRRFKFFYCCTGKGTGKTPMLGGVGLYALRYDGEMAAEIYGAAFDKNQSYIMLRDAIRMAETSPHKSEMALTIGKHNIAYEATNSFFRNESSEDRGKSGPRPHFVLIDELHEHRDGRVVTKMRAGFKRRRQPGMFLSTNAGFDRTSICWEYHQHSMKVLEEQVRDDQWFAFVCQLDPCEKCRADGYWQPNPGCKTCDDWKSPKVWAKANPSLDQGLPTKAYLQSQVDSTAIASNLSSVMQLNFGIWTSSRQTWIPADRWDACKVAKVSDANADGRPCAAGLDLSAKWDLSANVIAIRYDDPPTAPAPEVAEIEGLGADGQREIIKVTLNFSVELIPFFWLPREILLERVRTERIPFDQWERAGRLFVTDGPVIDHQVIYEHLVKVRKLFRVQRLGIDEANATMMFVKLRDEARMGDSIVSVGQGKKLSEAFKLMELLIRSRRLLHDGHPVLAWNIANAEPQRDRLGALWIEKPSDTLRIDGAVAAAMAVQQLMILPNRKRSGGGLIII